MVIALAAGIAFAATAIGTGWLAFRGPGRWFVDRPGARSLHDRPVSRAGGIAILSGLAAGLLIGAIMEVPGTRGSNPEPEPEPEPEPDRRTDGCSPGAS